MRDLRRGDVVWADFSPTPGREQAGERPAVVVASQEYLESLTELVIALPATRVDRGWPQHVRLTGQQLALPKPTWALTEQPRTISRDRLTRSAGHVDASCMTEIDQWLRDFVEFH